MRRQILKTIILVGSLDLAGASLSAFLVRGTTPAGLLKFIASGLFGKQALTGGAEMVLWGLFFHFLIVTAIVIIYFYSFPFLQKLKGGIMGHALLIATISWIVTNLLVIPLSRIGFNGFSFWGVLRSFSILFLCIGLPVSYLARQYYRKEF